MVVTGGAELAVAGWLAGKVVRWVSMATGVASVDVDAFGLPPDRATMPNPPPQITRKPSTTSVMIRPVCFLGGGGGRA